MKTKMILFSILIVTIACMLLGFFTYVSNKNIVKETQKKEHANNIRLSETDLNEARDRVIEFLQKYNNIAEDLNKEIENKKHIINLEIEKISSLDKNLKEERENTLLYGIFQDIQTKQESLIEYILLLDKENRVLMSYPFYYEGYFDIGRNKPEDIKPVFFDFTVRKQVEEETKSNLIEYSAKLIDSISFDDSNKESNFILMGLNLDNLKDNLKIPYEQDKRSEVYITDKNGMIFFHKDSHDKTDLNKMFTISELPIPLEETKERFHQSEPLTNYFNWQIWLDRELPKQFDVSIEKMTSKFNQRLLKLVILSIILAIPFGYFISLGIIRSIRKLSEGAVAISGGNYGYKVTVESRDEIGELARSFNTMSSQLKENIEIMEKELKEAHDLQMSLIPESPPEITGIQLSGLLIPAREVGGDYYDFVVQNNNLNIIVADSSGKVFAGAFSIMSTRGIVRNCISSDVDKPTNTLLSEIEKGVFLLGMKEQVTMVIARYDPDNRCISLSNAGNPPPILYSQSKGECERIKIVGLALNSPLSPEERPRQYDERKIDLTAGDVMVFYSDGLIEESTKDDRYGYQRLMDVIKESYDLDADKIVKRIHQSLIEFSQKDKDYTDDVSIVVIKVLT